ncbi:hypothetical protein BRADI_3g47413v3 [Brachypodium distachyon]|uniref:Uncharacterized protein n=1 Tax=Brachypodium distachyon TaxID=15368 RepID=A0A0Q3FKE7_BRADI|nr:hypothetical protein BRADI_3g47413v3 [Brachypodium distachyon]
MAEQHRAGLHPTESKMLIIIQSPLGQPPGSSPLPLSPTAAHNLGSATSDNVTHVSIDMDGSIKSDNKELKPINIEREHESNPSADPVIPA